MGLAVFVGLSLRLKERQRLRNRFLYWVLFRSRRLSGLFWGEIVIGLEIVTVFRILFIFLNNANVENCGNFKSFGFIYIFLNNTDIENC